MTEGKTQQSPNRVSSKTLTTPLIHIVLFEPEIPQNTGNIGRMCAFAGTRLHLIEPLGFEISDKQLRRSGMDYWNDLDVHRYPNWATFRDAPQGPSRLWLFTTHATKAHWEVTYQPGDGLVFGKETAGAPQWLHEDVGVDARIKIPQFAPQLRSLNLATSAGIGAYEALRQLNPSAL